VVELLAEADLAEHAGVELARRQREDLQLAGPARVRDRGALVVLAPAEADVEEDADLLRGEGAELNVADEPGVVAALPGDLGNAHEDAVGEADAVERRAAEPLPRPLLGANERLARPRG